MFHSGNLLITRMCPRFALALRQFSALKMSISQPYNNTYKITTPMADIPNGTIFIDDNYCIINKPPGVTMYGNLPVTVLKLVHHWNPSIAASGKTLKFIHRLDCDTSGILCIGLTSESSAIASRAFASRQVKKQYLAILQGHVDVTKYPLLDDSNTLPILPDEITPFGIISNRNTDHCSSFHSGDNSETESEVVVCKRKGAFKNDSLAKTQQFYHLYSILQELIHCDALLGANQNKPVHTETLHADNISNNGNTTQTTTTAVKETTPKYMFEMQRIRSDGKLYKAFQRRISIELKTYQEVKEERNALKLFIQRTNIPREVNKVRNVTQSGDSNKAPLKTGGISATVFANNVNSDDEDDDMVASAHDNEETDDIISTDAKSTSSLLLLLEEAINGTFDYNNSEWNSISPNTAKNTGDAASVISSSGSAPNDDRTTNCHRTDEKVSAVLPSSTSSPQASHPSVYRLPSPDLSTADASHNTNMNSYENRIHINIPLAGYMGYWMEPGRVGNPGRFAQTTVDVLEHGFYQGQPVTKVLLTPHTGRRHQLRVHCLCLGHPIVGDLKYNIAHRRAVATAQADHQQKESSGVEHQQGGLLAERMMLHAYKLRLPVPHDGRTRVGGTRREGLKHDSLLLDCVTPDPFVFSSDGCLVLL